MASHIVTLTREELYERIWSTPMTTLAKEFVLSDVAIAKRCKAHGIPKPPVGYWAKKEAGRRLRDRPFRPRRGLMKSGSTRRTNSNRLSRPYPCG